MARTSNPLIGHSKGIIGGSYLTRTKGKNILKENMRGSHGTRTDAQLIRQNILTVQQQYMRGILQAKPEIIPNPQGLAPTQLALSELNPVGSRLTLDKKEAFPINNALEIPGLKMWEDWEISEWVYNEATGGEIEVTWYDQSERPAGAGDQTFTILIMARIGRSRYKSIILDQEAEWFDGMAQYVLPANIGFQAIGSQAGSGGLEGYRGTLYLLWGEPGPYGYLGVQSLIPFV